MKITIAGAGAGKTSKMASQIIEHFSAVPGNKNIYCVAFTNNAVECIESKLKRHYGIVPLRIHVNTIHSFLYNEIVKPYYYLLYGKHYERILNTKLPGKPQWKIVKILLLDSLNILHVNAIPERAKWVMSKKTNDSKEVKRIRKSVQRTFTSYCDSIFFDEAQDIYDDFLEVLKAFDELKITLEVVGDPKQDLKGFRNLRVLVDSYPDRVEYITECHRCPQRHLLLSNTLVCKNEQQSSQKSQGDVRVVFESDLSVQAFIDESGVDLMYISKKNNRFDTHKAISKSAAFDILYDELISVLAAKQRNSSGSDIERCAFYLADGLIDKSKEYRDPGRAMSAMFLSYRLDKKEYARVIACLQMVNDSDERKTQVNSIESIKGREGNNCLFILTGDLAPYFFMEKVDENKTKNMLYVALTRSLNDLTIMITFEVEKKYGRDFISKYIECTISCEGLR